MQQLIMSSSKNTQSSSGFKPKEQQPPKVYVEMRDKNFAEKARQKDGLPPVDKHASKQQFPQLGSKQNLGQMNDSKKK